MPAAPPDLLVSGPERAPRRPGGARTLTALLALAVAAGGVASVPTLRDRARAAQEPPVVTATTSGGTAFGGRLRVWLLLAGPPSARLSQVDARLPGSAVRTTAPRRFSAGGDAVVRLDVTPGCPAATAGLADAALALTVGEKHALRLPIDTDGILAGTVRARCDGTDDARPAAGPLVRADDGGPPGVLRTVVELGAPGPEVLVVTAVAAGPGLSVTPVTALPLRVRPGSRGRLVVDLRAAGCAAVPDEPPFLLEYAAEGEVEPRVDVALRGRLAALRRSGC